MKISDLLNENELKEAWADKLVTKLLSPAAKAAMAAGQKSLAKGAAKGVSKVAPKVAAPVAQSGGVGKLVKATGKLLTILKFLGIAKMAYDYYADVSWGESQVKKGEWNAEQFADYRQGKMTVLVTQLAASVFLFNAIKIFSGWSLFTTALRLSRIPAISTFGTFLAGLDKAAQLAIIATVQTQGARKYIAELIGTGLIDDTLGGNGVALVDKVKDALGIKSEVPKPEDKPENKPDNAQADIGATSGAVLAPNTPLQSPTKPGNVSLGDNPTMFRKPDGQLDIGLDPEFMDKKPKK